MEAILQLGSQIPYELIKQFQMWLILTSQLREFTSWRN